MQVCVAHYFLLPRSLAPNPSCHLELELILVFLFDLATLVIHFEIGVFLYFGKCSIGHNFFYDGAKYFYIHLYFGCNLYFIHI